MVPVARDPEEPLVPEREWVLCPRHRPLVVAQHTAFRGRPHPAPLERVPVRVLPAAEPWLRPLVQAVALDLPPLPPDPPEAQHPEWQ